MSGPGTSGEAAQIRGDGMNEMEERVARAIRDGMDQDLASITIAGMAIEAMRKADRRMIEAGAAKLETSTLRVMVAWDAMIDEALR